MGASKSRVASSPSDADLRQKSIQVRQQIASNYRHRQPHQKSTPAAAQMAMLQAPTAPFVPKRTTGESPDDYDAEAKRRMQDQLAWDSQTFVLNQLLLGVQFFDNYEREMWQAVGRNRLHENQKTRQIERHCKVAILPDRLQEAVDRRIKYRPRHGLQKHIDRPLHPQTMYIVHENIEVANPGERSNYSILTDAPIYKMEIDTNFGAGSAEPRHKSTTVGYVRLRCVEGIRINREHLGGAPASAEDDDAEASERRSSADDDDNDESGISTESPAKLTRKTHRKHRDSIIIRRRRRGEQQLGATSAGVPQTSSSSSTENDYAYISSLNVRKPLSSATAELPNARTSARSADDESHLSASTLPDACFTHVTEDSASEDDDVEHHEYENDTNNNHRHSRHRRRLVHQFLNAKSFLANFVHLFRERLADDIGITAAHLNTATWKAAVITAQPWDVVPALSCPWPNEAFEWLHRRRDIKLHPVTQQRFQWPTPGMVSKVVSFGCLAIPVGRVPKRRSVTVMSEGSTTASRAELEWKLVFPNAERYLEGCLTAAQCKVYVLTKALLQTFVEPYCGDGFGAEHLRAHLFWQCENNYAAWPEEYLGEALVRFLNALLEHIKRQRLPDYFLPGRNLFESVPERVMVDLHRRIFRITENPVMYTMIALRNLRWLNNDAVAESGTAAAAAWCLDVKQLYGIITVANPLAMVNPNFRASDDGKARAEGFNANAYGDADESIENAMGAIGYHQRVDRDVKSKRRKTRRRVRFVEASRSVNDESEVAARRASVESIDVRFPIVRHMEQLRRVLIYELFIQHFVQLARQALPHRAYGRALTYLRQASRLCALLADDDRREQAASHRTVIRTLQLVVQNERDRDADAKPQLPLRGESVREASGSGGAAAASGQSVRVDKADALRRPNGAYSNAVAIERAAEKKTVAAAAATEVAVTRAKPSRLLTIRCDIHQQEADDDGVVEPRRPQSPIGAISFFDRDASGGTDDDGEDDTAL